MCADVNEYERVARETKMLFESRFGEFSSKDFREVAKLLGFELLPLKVRPTCDERYEKLSEQERSDVDFMMGL